MTSPSQTVEGLLQRIGEPLAADGVRQSFRIREINARFPRPNDRGRDHE